MFGIWQTRFTHYGRPDRPTGCCWRIQGKCREGWWNREAADDAQAFPGALSSLAAQKGVALKPDATREVIDGQQRITALQILLLAFRDVIKPMGDELDDDTKANLTLVSIGERVIAEGLAHECWPRCDAGVDGA